MWVKCVKNKEEERVKLTEEHGERFLMQLEKLQMTDRQREKNLRGKAKEMVDFGFGECFFSFSKGKERERERFGS